MAKKGNDPDELAKPILQQIKDSRIRHNALVAEYSKTSDTNRKKEIEASFTEEEALRAKLMGEAYADDEKKSPDERIRLSRKRHNLIIAEYSKTSDPAMKKKAEEFFAAEEKLRQDLLAEI